MAPGLPLDVLVGRDGELARLRRLVTEVADGRGRSVWVEGEPGIGKSALLTAGLADARRSGCAVFWESADEARQQFPLWVLLDCLHVGSRSAGPARVEIAGLLRGEGAAGALTPGDVTAAVAERLLVLVDRLCELSPVVLVVDDLQWADEASLAVWARLRQVVRQLPLLLVAAYRPVPVRAKLVAQHDGTPGKDAVVLELGPLAADQVVELVERLVGAPPGPRLRREAEQSGGNPLYLRELIDALVREQAVQVADGMAELVSPAMWPVSLAAAIGRRLGWLPESTVRVLQMAALLGPEFSVAHLCAVTGQPGGELAGVVREAVAAGVLTESGSRERFTFRHGLIRQALYEAMPAAVRSGLHRHAAQALAGAGAPVERVAKHLLAAPGTTDAWVVGWVTEAGRTLTHRAPQVAVELLQRAREAVHIDDRRRELLDAHLVTALFLLGQYEQVERLAYPLLARTRDPDVAGRMAWTLGYTLLHTARHDQALAVTGQAVAERALTGVWTARVRALRAQVLTSAGHYDEAAATAARAEADGELAGDRLAIGYAVHALSMIESHHRRDEAAWLQAIDRALVVLGEEPETVDLRLLLLGNRATALGNLGRPAEANLTLGQALALAEHTGTPPRLAGLRVKAAGFCFYRGRWDDALAELDAAADLPQHHRRLWLRGLAALIALHRDDRAAVLRHLHDAEDVKITAGEMRYYVQYLMTARALTAERDGDSSQALAQLLALFDLESTRRFPELPQDSYLWLPDVVRLALATGDLASAEAATEACVAEARRQRLPPTYGAALHCRGLLAADPILLLDAATTFDRIALPLFRAHALENAAVLLAGRGDTEAARVTYADAVQIYTGLDAAWDILRADTRLRPLGIRRGSRGPRRRPVTGWRALTPTEIKIAELVAEGRSNPDIAAGLFLSRRTVQSHVSHILAKLGAHSRIDIAREASRHRRTVPGDPRPAKQLSD